MRRNSNTMYIVIAPTKIGDATSLNLKIAEEEKQLEKWI